MRPSPLLTLALIACTPPWKGLSVSFGDTGVDTAPEEPPEEEGPCGGWSSEWSALEEEVLALVNEVRAQGYTCYDGYKPPADPLTMEPLLRCAARLHSQDMGENNFFSHTGSDGSSMSQRVEAQGYVGWFSLGENIAAGIDRSRDAVDLWLASTEGHCSNIMGSGYSEIGIGAYFSDRSSYGWYWTQDFGSR